MSRTISEVCAAIVDCEHKSAPIEPSGTYFAVGTPAMRGNRINYDEARRIDAPTFEAWTRRLTPRRGDLLFAREAPVGPVVRIPAAENVAPGQRTMLLRPDSDLVDSDYLYYLMSSPFLQGQFEALSEGSTVPHLNVSDVKRLALPRLPSVAEQRAIADVLGALDDKIAANAKLATTADELVRTWYLDLRRSADGIRDLGDLVENVRDLVEPVSAQGMYVGLEHVPRRRMWLDNSGDVSEVTSAKAVFKRSDVLFGKLRPYFHKVVSAPGAGVCSTDILVLRAKDPSVSGLALAAGSSDEAIAEVNAASEGTRMPRANWRDLAAVPVPWPGDAAARAFSANVDTLRAAVEQHLAENRRLAATRDALLPALMSGRLRVEEAAEVADAL